MLLKSAVNVMGALCGLFDVSMDIYDGKVTSENVSHTP